MTFGTFYGVGVGPGDPELMTLKARRILTESPVLAIPQSHGSGKQALEIVEALVDLSQKTILELDMPMVREEDVLAAAHDRAAEAVMEILALGEDVAMPNLGDVSIYSTYAYLMKRVKAKGFAAEMIPGVPSFCHAAARLGISLTDRDLPLLVIPGEYPDMPRLLQEAGTKVLMKSGRRIPETVGLIREMGLAHQVMAVENCGMPGETLYRSAAQLEAGAGYFTTIIMKEEKE